MGSHVTIVAGSPPEGKLPPVKRAPSVAEVSVLVAILSGIRDVLGKAASAARDGYFKAALLVAQWREAGIVPAWTEAPLSEFGKGIRSEVSRAGAYLSRGYDAEDTADLNTRAYRATAAALRDADTDRDAAKILGDAKSGKLAAPRGRRGGRVKCVLCGKGKAEGETRRYDRVYVHPPCAVRVAAAMAQPAASPRTRKKKAAA